MSQEQRTRWDRRYSESTYRPRSTSSPFLEEWLRYVPVGRALDVACGAGRHALRLAETGFSVDAVDISTVAVKMAAAEATRRGLVVNWQTTDLDDLAIEPGVYQVITVFRFRASGLWPRLVEALAPDGWILVEHHLLTPQQVDGPDLDFRVAPGELLDAFRGLRVLHYSEKIESEGEKTYANVRLAACKGYPGW